MMILNKTGFRLYTIALGCIKRTFRGMRCACTCRHKGRIDGEGQCWTHACTTCIW